MSSFTQKKLDITFQLGEGDFGTAGFNTVKLSGLRAQASISRAGGLFRSPLSLRVFGLTPSQLTKLSKVGRLSFSTTLNRVIVAAGDESLMTTIYNGSIYEAWADFNDAPDVAMEVNAGEGFYEAIQPIPASSYKGRVDPVQILAKLAAALNFNLEPNGLAGTVFLSNPYFPGTGIDQINACADAAGFDFVIETDTLAIWPRGGARPTPIVPIISPATGMVGYPRFNATGISVKTLFNPAIRFGSIIEVQSSLAPASGIWRVNQLAHNLASETPNGEWFTTMECAYLDKSIFKGF